MATHYSNIVDEEYLKVLRTQSYAKYYEKAHSLVMQIMSSSPSLCSLKLSEILLEPQQDSVITIVESAIFPKQYSDLKPLVQKYFDVSAKASKMCTQLLFAVKQAQYNQQYIKSALALMSSYASLPDSNLLQATMLELDSFNSMKNPFSNTNVGTFILLHKEYSSILHQLSLKKKLVARRIKLNEFLRRGTKLALRAADNMIALFVGCLPAVLNTKERWIRESGNEFLKKAGSQLDAAAMGTYILQRDFDTVSRMVAGVGDEIEHNKGMIRFCMEKERRPLQEVVKEFRKGDESFTSRVEELEEHVYLCLVMINRARLVVANEM